MHGVGGRVQLARRLWLSALAPGSEAQQVVIKDAHTVLARKTWRRRQMQQRILALRNEVRMWRQARYAFDNY